MGPLIEVRSGGMKDQGKSVGEKAGGTTSVKRKSERRGGRGGFLEGRVWAQGGCRRKYGRVLKNKEQLIWT